MNLFWREMKANRKSLIIWGIGLLFMVVAGMAKYEGYSSSGQSINELISQMPKSLQVIIGTGDLDLSTAIGFYGMLFYYLLLLAAIHALMLGANIIAKEERDKTAEFLMAKPISRTRIISSKLLAALVNVVIFNLVTLVLSLAMVSHYQQTGEQLDDIYLLMAGMFLVQLIFLAVGAVIAAVGKRPKRAAALGTVLLLLTYLLSIAVDLNEKIEWLQYVTPFKYFEAKRVLADGTLETTFVAITIVVVTILIAITYHFYQKRDLQI
ncbi:ABC transporter permease subunit [Neobacillus sp. OS1-32]|uniref:ABC transporter permease subunit n=1 Tax=Neobacillus sp. OS1-32 TaxID=3070682 RepID=UPI0027E179C9|nr:ABC transporter permease subunit [Neobacillus sp. OS1-32]WML29684.1 ABC transporter permease subunit [Neobacillus sp. OS1-32]